MVHLFLICTSALIANFNIAITNLVEVEKARSDIRNTNRTFSVCAPVITRLDANNGLLLLGDGNGVAQFEHLRSNQDPVLIPGDMVRSSGDFVAKRQDILYAVCRKLDVIGHLQVPTPNHISAKDFLSGRFDYRLSQIKGSVKDIFPDEIDANYSFLVIQSGEETLYAACRNLSATNSSSTAVRPGCEIALIGVPLLSNPINRLHLGRYFYVPDPNSIHIIKTAPVNDSRLPELRSVLKMRPQEISKLGRHRAIGRVLSVMHDDSFLMRTKDNLIVRVGIGKSPQPLIGAIVEAIGFPESNLYYLDLIRSFWHPCTSVDFPDPLPTEVEPEAISHFSNGRPVIDPRYHGRLVRMSGKILSLPDPNNSEDILRLDCQNHIISIDVGNIEIKNLDLSRECSVKITGVCVLDVETWRPNAAFPHIRGFTIVPRSPEDIDIVSRPPWWTPRRFCILLSILVPAILISLALNFILRKIVERRSSALLKEQSAKLIETLRVDERTRLAAELHDSVAQDLSGISMQIETAEALATNAPEKLRQILVMASRSLLNCREELRNCLWDLRSHALDERNLGNAIARTIKPHLEGVELVLKFNVPRSVVSDATAHATLQIVRELVTNAIRHGHAKHLRICGTIDKKRLLFSVVDDGCGFDLNTVPGVVQGHFGLSGIRERIRKLGGTITIQSSAGNGTKATITL